MLKVDASNGILRKELEKLVIIPRHFDIAIDFKDVQVMHPLDCFIELFAITEEDFEITNP